MSSSAASIIYLSMDVHKDSITIAVLPMTAKNPTRLERLPNDLSKLKRFLDRVARDGGLRVGYKHRAALVRHDVVESAFAQQNGIVLRLAVRNLVALRPLS